MIAVAELGEEARNLGLCRLKGLLFELLQSRLDWGRFWNRMNRKSDEFNPHPILSYCPSWSFWIPDIGIEVQRGQKFV